jgi:hypothetical protein
MSLFNFGHDCKIYFPKDPKKGDEFKCMCGAKYICVRIFPWAKWEDPQTETRAHKPDRP